VGAEVLECREIGIAGTDPKNPTLVFLHEGLGSVSMWRGTPKAVCETLGCNGLVFSRMGYGSSSRLAGPRPVAFMEREANDVLPLVLDHFRIERPFLVGHSDGASIALLYAARTSTRAVAALVMAPHVFVEDIALKAIAATREAYLEGPLRERLKSYHADVDGAFFGWNDIWLDPAFQAWNITAKLPAIACPVAVIQGEEDEYGTMQQLEVVADAVADASAHRLANCRHSPHRDQAEAVIAIAAALLLRVATA
jgi:pimeloyl-ACP methyl ester carboxylesterase